MRRFPVSSSYSRSRHDTEIPVSDDREYEKITLTSSDEFG